MSIFRNSEIRTTSLCVKKTATPELCYGTILFYHFFAESSLRSGTAQVTILFFIWFVLSEFD